ncbi:hypothetical protein GWK47_043810 [Chionoecetes opilio]|uniref:Protein CUSTOS n=1 Tax=Chionoecetes opilio TaxID=41210 RepID=A0A8J4YKT2_CHIOP|nr:hypothetical protein GWK47_043810 [Chionoecetes opilio]
MSDSSSSDGEESRFREICDPTFWRTAEEGVEDGKPLVQPASLPALHDNRQSFVLLEKIRASLAAAHTNNAGEGSGTRKRGSAIGEVSVRGVPAAASTLSPYLAKQLAIRLDSSVDYSASQDDPPPAGQECGSADQPASLFLLKHQALLPQGQDTQQDSQGRKRRVKVPKRLAYYNSSDEDEVKSRCRSVAVSPEWILDGNSCPPPHPKNLRYLDEYKMKECRPDGSIIAIPLSEADATVTSKGLRKNKKVKAKECVVPNGKDNASNEKGNVQCSPNVTVNVTEHSKAGDNTPRKQARKRGKKKKNLETK